MNGTTALLFAIQNGHADVVQALLAKGADANAQASSGEIAEEPALFVAAQYGGHDVVQVLLRMKGIAINARRYDGRTPLMIASYLGYRDVVQVLLAKGADVNARDNNGQTALMNTRDGEIKSILLQAGARS